MDVKEAVTAAREYLADLYLSEQVSNVGLEEVVFDDDSNEWRITIGFSRPWDQETPAQNAFTALASPRPSRPERSYKVVCIDDLSEEVTALKDRLLAASN